MKLLRNLATIVILAALALLLRWHGAELPSAAPSEIPPAAVQTDYSIPAYAGEPWVQLGDNRPRFDRLDLAAPFEAYSPLDNLGRCGPALACIGTELMPTEERESIGMVRPSGWQLVKYDFVDGKYLYNRCHLIGFQLTGENANEENLITGTRYMNVQGMLPFENQVANYIRRTGNHVLYRVTPEFDGDDLLCTGVRMEAYSVEDNGAGVCFHVFAYNVQPGVTIDYATGESRLTEEAAPTQPAPQTPAPSAPESSAESIPADVTYLLNTRSMKFHLPTCSGARDIKAANRQNHTGSREELLSAGYTPCGTCRP